MYTLMMHKIIHISHPKEEILLWVATHELGRFLLDFENSKFFLKLINHNVLSVG